MPTDTNAKLAPQPSHTRPLRSLRLMIVSAVLVLVASTSAFGQMGYSVWYSDSWVDYNSNPGYVIGCGITSDSYNSYGHRYWVNTSLRSPSGRTAYGDSSTSATYARVDVYLSWDYETDFGDFITTTTHSMTCPYIYGIVNATTSIGIRVGASSITFQNSGVRDSQNRCIMNIIEPCNVICTGRRQTNETECWPYSIWIEPWYRWGDGNYICLGFFSSVLERRLRADYSQPCFES